MRKERRAIMFPEAPTTPATLWCPSYIERKFPIVAISNNILDIAHILTIVFWFGGTFT